MPPIPGELNGKWDIDPLRNPAALISAMNADGLQIVSKDRQQLPQNKPGFYVVGVYLNPGGDFHFVRQDADGGWSDKPGIGNRVDRYLEPAADGGYRPLPQNFSDVLPKRFAEYMDQKLEFVGYGYAPREGIDLGPEKAVMASLQSGSDITSFLKCEPAWRIKMLGDTLAKYYDPKLANEYETARLHYSAKSNEPEPPGRKL